MKRIYCLRRHKTPDITVVAATNHAQAVMKIKQTIIGNYEFEHIATCSLGGYLSNEEAHRLKWSELAEEKFREEAKNNL